MHGATISKSSNFFGPIGSASLIVLIISLLHLDFIVFIKSSLLPNLVSVLYAVSLMMGIIFAPAAERLSSSCSTFLKVQKDL